MLAGHTPPHRAACARNATERLEASQHGSSKHGSSEYRGARLPRSNRRRGLPRLQSFVLHDLVSVRRRRGDEWRALLARFLLRLALFALTVASVGARVARCNPVAWAASTNRQKGDRAAAVDQAAHVFQYTCGSLQRHPRRGASRHVARRAPCLGCGLARVRLRSGAARSALRLSPADMRDGAGAPHRRSSPGVYSWRASPHAPPGAGFAEFEAPPRARLTPPADHWPTKSPCVDLVLLRDCTSPTNRRGLWALMATSR